jgi:aspartate aminotransferase-like enzyme
VRMGTMGDLTRTDLLRGLEAFETVLQRSGHAFEPGAGMHAARAILQRELTAAR